MKQAVKMDDVKEAYKTYTYINGLGRMKKIVTGKKKNGKYPFTLWDIQTGEFCGWGERTPEELQDFLDDHYGIESAEVW